MLHLSESCNYYLYSGHADMRKGFDSLSGIVNSQMALNVLSGSVFIFMNRRRTHIKLLVWEGDGFAIYYKRLEKGTYELPAGTAQSSRIAMDARQLQFILQGVSLKKVSFRPRLKNQPELSTGYFWFSILPGDLYAFFPWLFRELCSVLFLINNAAGGAKY